MSTQDFWSCLSVQEFFSSGNWQGQLQEKRNGQYQDQPLTLNYWQRLSVQEFFSLGDWQGQLQEKRNGQYQDQFLYLTLQAEAAIASRLNSWQCLSVQEFFNLGNWHQLRENYNWHPIDQSSRLTLQVQDFFQFISWEGTPEIGSLPKESSLPEIVTPSKTRVTDLSSLF